MAGPGEDRAAGGGGHGHLRASDADRERVIGLLKAAFVQGRLEQDEFGPRVGQALASRTYGDLAAVTADRAQDEWAWVTVPRAGAVLTAATALYAGVWPVALALPRSGADHDPHGGVGLVVTATFVYLIVMIICVGNMLISWIEKRPRGQQPSNGAGRDFDTQRAAVSIVKWGVVDRAGGEDEDQISPGEEGDCVARP
jgi:Domain of unknown function (DUF1707)